MLDDTEVNSEKPKNPKTVKFKLAMVHEKIAKQNSGEHTVDKAGAPTDKPNGEQTLLGQAVMRDTGAGNKKRLSVLVIRRVGVSVPVRGVALEPFISYERFIKMERMKRTSLNHHFLVSYSVSLLFYMHSLERERV